MVLTMLITRYSIFRYIVGRTAYNVPCMRDIVRDFVDIVFTHCIEQ